jgi:hypothetical protein
VPVEERAGAVTADAERGGAPDAEGVGEGLCGSPSSPLGWEGREADRDRSRLEPQYGEALLGLGGWTCCRRPERTKALDGLAH